VVAFSLLQRQIGLISIRNAAWRVGKTGGLLLWPLPFFQVRRRECAMKRWLVVLIVLIPALVVAGSTATVAQDSPTVQTAEDPTFGTFLTDAEGMTLYMFTRDSPNESVCYDDCAANWPIFSVEGELTLPEGVEGTLGTIERTDGTTQVTYNEMPLYYWVNDAQPGDITGQGVGAVWFIIPPGATFADFGVVAAPAAEGSPTASPVAEAGTTVLVRRNQDLGTFLVDAEGMTLYLFTNDTTPGESACYDQCAENWPPLVAVEPLQLAPGIPGTLGTITRTDGTLQVTYNDMPLYYYVDDVEAGDTNGQGAGDVWFVVQIGAETATPTA
jgi:predicted lipoprotein with Yx(FWY)xxD motif